LSDDEDDEIAAAKGASACAAPAPAARELLVGVGGGLTGAPRLANSCGVRAALSLLRARRGGPRAEQRAAG
jgi:hypothetical protein